jgi:hypothetical protein
LATACALPERYPWIVESAPRNRHSSLLSTVQMADKTDPTIARFWRDAAKQWKAMAAQLELLEQEPVYRIIRSRRE